MSEEEVKEKGEKNHPPEMGIAYKAFFKKIAHTYTSFCYYLVSLTNSCLKIAIPSTDLLMYV